MNSKVDTSDLEPEQRPGILREIIGILLGLIALLLLLALTSVNGETHTHWIGEAGDWVAKSLAFIFGNYIAYLVPAMIGICAYNVLRGELSIASFGASWRRGLGGLMVVVSACALLTLSVSTETEQYTEEAYRMGGLIGNYLIISDYVKIGMYLGRIGSIAFFSAVMLCGIVMFTEFLVRELVQIVWRGAAATTAGAQRFTVRWVRLPGRGFFVSIGRLLWRPFAWFYSLGLPARFIGWMRRLKFTQPDNRRVFKSGENPVERRTFGNRRKEPAPAMANQRQPESYPVEEESAAFYEGVEGGFQFEVPEIEAPLETIVPAFTDGLGRPRTEAARPVPAAARKAPRKAEPAGQDMLNLFPNEYRMPGFELLADPPTAIYEMSDEEKDRLSRKIEQTLAQFKVEVQVIEVIQGPVITRFALKVAPGVRVNRIQALESELAMALKAVHVRILAPIPGQAAVGIEVPNKRANPVMLKDLITSDAFQNHKSPLAFALGKNIGGEPVICDLAQMPHLLIAGTTGSGKSVCLNAIIASFLYRNKPDRVKFVMIDPKRVELSIYQAIPHLIAPVVSETKKAAAALAWCVEQMEERYKILASVGGVRNVDAYNALLAEKTPNKKLLGHGDLKYLPHIVIIIDELADLMMVARNEVEEYIIRLAQMARAVGMHLVLATQRPSVNVITGIIKANFPSRIAFQVSSKVDSRTILDLNGAEALMGRGDMLYSPGGAKPFRIQGAYVADSEVERLADYIRAQETARYEKEDFEAQPTPSERAKAHTKQDEDGLGEPGSEIDAAAERVNIYLDGMATAGRAGLAPLTPADMEQLSDEDLYDMALRIVLESRKASVSYIQRRMKIGYARAGRIMDMMEERGIVGPYQGSKPRDLLVNPEDFFKTDN